MNTKLIIRYSIRESMGLLVMGLALFWTRGSIHWWQAWAALTVMLLWIIATAVVILRFNPSLLAERLGPRKGAKRWDIAIMSLLGMTQLARYVIAGLDQRYSWTGGYQLAVQITALIVCTAGYAVVVWATASNAFFSQVVRIQSERGHTVVTGGPYHYVRHPAYIGSILYELTVPFLLSSWWALIPGIFNAILLVIRTSLEDQTLRRELTGYVQYAAQVRFRLLPGIW